MKRRSGFDVSVALLALILIGEVPAHAISESDALDALVAAYPAALARHDGQRLYWRDGTVMQVSDGVSEKNFQQLLGRASIIDQLRMPYPSGRLAEPPALNADPGRFRNIQFFDKMYGDCDKHEVDRNLVTVVWLPKTWGKTIEVTRVNGVDERLRAISAEIDELPAAIKRAAYPTNGTFSCRKVRDTGVRSMHAYAAAVDLNIKSSDYWMWSADKGKLYRNRMPYEIVEIFERNGFIWGGKWYHYDTMHFEFRPELLRMSPKP